MAGRICDHLKARYGGDSVYMDIDNIPLGIDFRDHIYGALDKADVLVVIVGQKWLGTDQNGQHRIAGDNDFVRAEIEAALKRNIPVVPVLVDGATMPGPSNLPDSLKPFTFRHAAAIDTGVDFHQHMDRLTRSLDRMVGAEPRWEGRRTRLRTAARQARWALPGMAAMAAITAAILWWSKPSPPHGGPLATGDRTGPVQPGGIGGNWEPPPGRSRWLVEKSILYLEATGDRRQFYFITPDSDWTVLGVQPGALLFDGRKIGLAYEGTVVVYAGGCPKHGYDASGPITNDSTTVTLIGKVPRIDPRTCVKLGDEERTLVFNLKGTGS
jgi:hypothetical protein